MTCYFDPKTGRLVAEDGKPIKIDPPKFAIFRQAKKFCNEQGIKLAGLFCGARIG